MMYRKLCSYLRGLLLILFILIIMLFLDKTTNVVTQVSVTNLLRQEAISLANQTSPNNFSNYSFERSILMKSSELMGYVSIVRSLIAVLGASITGYANQNCSRKFSVVFSITVLCFTTFLNFLIYFVSETKSIIPILVLYVISGISGASQATISVSINMVIFMIESDLPDSRQRNSSKMFLISLLNFFIPGGNGLAAKFGTYLIDRLTIKWLYAFLIFITFSFSLLVIQSLCHVPAKEILGDSNSIFSLIWRPFYESYKILKSLFNNTQVGINNGITLIIVVLANFFTRFLTMCNRKLTSIFLPLFILTSLLQNTGIFYSKVFRMMRLVYSSSHLCYRSQWNLK